MATVVLPTTLITRIDVNGTQVLDGASAGDVLRALD